ncbi:nuclear transport factor 2 family protein [Rhizobium sp.]|uniref:nuclear transport factor 2 family protein n=1 Tax=Rhizobium sp. TaxID=391 RepID=UPI000E9FA53D|nr:nuclear transport factor 2 family protein [Rhizobium sp.]
MERIRFNDYINRFNERDATAFDEFIAPDMQMLNGALEFTGVAGMRDHYENKIWPYFEERLNVLEFVSSEDTLAIQMWTRFTAFDKAETLFGLVEKGETFDYRGVILYKIAAGKFSKIVVAYNSFINTKVNGEHIMMGMPH